MFPLQTIWEKTKKREFKTAHGILAYEVVGKTYIVAGDPLAKTLSQQTLVLQKFKKYVQAQGGRVCGYYFSQSVAENSGLQAHMLGVARILDLDAWSLHGRESEEFRRVLRKGRKSLLKIEELTFDRINELKVPLKTLDKKWKATKAPFQIGFLLSSLSQTVDKPSRSERFFICWQASRIASLVSLRPYFAEGDRVGWYVDHLIREPSADKYATDYLLAKVFLQLKSEGAREVSLGLCPFVIKKKQKSHIERAMQILSHLKFLYSSKGLYVFKRKYTNKELPRFLLVDPEDSLLKQLVALERVTFKIH